MSTWLLAAALISTNVAIPFESPPVAEGGSPTITLWAYPSFGDFYHFTGTVTDPGGNPPGYTVTFFGNISGTTTVVTTGQYLFTAEVPGGSGTVWAVTVDRDGNASNIAMAIIW